MADKLFREYFNERDEVGEIPVGGKILVQTGTDEPQKIDKSLLTPSGGYEGTASDLDAAISGAVSGFQGALLIADVPTLDGSYTPIEEGTYPNAGSLVYSPSTTDLGFDVKFIKDGATWTKSRVDISGSLVPDFDDFLTDFIFARESFLISVRDRDLQLPKHRFGISDGQSNAEDRVGGNLSTAGQDHFMPIGGNSLKDFAAYAENQENVANYNEYTSLTKYVNSDNEGGHGVGYGLGATGSCASSSFFHRAVGSRDLDILFSGGLRANLFMLLERMCFLIRERGEAPFPDFGFTQGEAEMGTNDSYAKRKIDVAEAFIDMQLAAAWGCGNPNYLTKIAYNQVIASTLTGAHINILKADQDVIKTKSNVSFITSPYDKTFENDRVHFTGFSIPLMGQSQAIGNENEQQFYNLEKPSLQFAERVGDLIEISHRVTGGYGLTIDEEREYATYLDLTTSLKGYQIYRNGAYLDLTGASIKVFGTKVFLKLAADPGVILADERVDYAMQYYGGTLTFGAHKIVGGLIKSTKPKVISSTMVWQKVFFNIGFNSSGVSNIPSGLILTGDISGATGTVHHTVITSGSFDTDDAAGYLLLFNYSDIFNSGEIFRGSTLRVTTTSTGTEEPVVMEDWLVRGSVQITEK